MTRDEGDKIFRRLKDILAKGGVPFVVHEHEPKRTIEEAERNLSFAVERIVKTVAF
jgi:predicted DNA-binding transcriptional regulator